MPPSEPVRPVFAGVHTLLTLIWQLGDRPRFLSRSEDQELRGDQPLPLVCLVRRSDRNAFLGALATRLRAQATSQVPHAVVDAPAAAEATRRRWTPDGGSGADAAPPRALPLLPLLDELSVRLAADTFGSGRLTRFDHYRLVDWLTGQELPPPSSRDDRENVVHLLREWSGKQARTDPGLAAAAAELAPTASTKLGLRVLLWVGSVIGFRWVRKRVLGLGRETRWLMRGQGFMVPRHSSNILGFAERLTVGRRGSEDPDELKKLLVHAFLEDLRIAYRRRLWRVLPRRAGWRRTAYVTVLLDGVAADNGGWELLRLINEVRNETGELDPLLVVAASDDPPPMADAGLEPVPAADACDALAVWRRNLPSRRQRLTSDARYLPVRLPDAAAGADARKLDRVDRYAWETGPPFRPRRPPLPAARGLVEAVLAVSLVVAAVPVGRTALDHWAADCSVRGSAAFDGRFAAGVAVRPVDVARRDRQCVGYSGRARQVFGTNARLRKAQANVFAENAEAERIHAANSRRPYVGIVYFAGLTHRGTDPDTDHAVAEELEGILLRQREQNARSRSGPLLRVLVANGGAKMAAAPLVVRDMLLPLFAADPTLLGVVGLERTVGETEDAISQLGAHGIPVVGTTLTGTGLGDRSPLYFQMVPANARQAELVTAYARHVGARTVTIYHPPLGGTDSYVTTLVQALRNQWPQQGLALREVGWRHSVEELPSPCDGAGAGSTEVAFYAGREDGFGDFLRRLTAGCYDRRRIPRIVADDAVSRFVAQEQDRSHAALAGTRVAYVAIGGLVVLAGRSCLAGRPAAAVGGGTPLETFCAGYGRLHRELVRSLPAGDRPATLWPGERVGLAYDAVGAFVEAVREMGRRTGPQGGDGVPHRAAVAQLLREVPFAGATGLVDFRVSRIGDNRAIAIVEIADIGDLGSDPTCGYLLGDLYEPTQRRLANGCPAPSAD